MCHTSRLGNETESSACDNLGLRAGIKWRVQVQRGRTDLEDFKSIPGFLGWSSFQEATRRGTENASKGYHSWIYEPWASGTRSLGLRPMGASQRTDLFTERLLCSMQCRELVARPGKVRQHQHYRGSVGCWQSRPQRSAPGTGLGLWKGERRGQRLISKVEVNTTGTRNAQTAYH